MSRSSKGLPKTCFIDLDGVLVDFSAAVSRWFGTKVTQYEPWHELGISKSTFWNCISNHQFWAEAPWTEFGLELLGLIEQTFPSCFIASSPILSCYSASGKVEWIQKNVPQYARRFFITPNKTVLGHPLHLLIDDQDNNCAGFAAQGGSTFLVPQVWNAKGAGDPIKDFKEWLGTLPR